MRQTTERIERLSEDLLDDEFVSSFLLPHLVLTAIGFQRVRIRFKFVSTPSQVYRFYSCLFWLTNVGAVVDYSINNKTVIESMDHLIKFGLIINTLINAEIARQNMFCNNHLNSQLYVKMQKLYRTQFTGSRSGSKYVNKRAIFDVILCCAPWFGYMYVFNTEISSTFRLSGCIAACSGMALNIEVGLCYIILINVRKTVASINDNLRHDLTQAKNDMSNDVLGKSCIWITNNFFKADPPEQTSSNIAQNIRSVLELLADFVKLFQYPVLGFTCQLLLWVMIFVQSVISATKEQMTDHSSSHLNAALTSGLSILAIATTFLALCFLTQSLVNKLEDMRSLCFRVMTSRQCEDKLRGNAKNGLLLLDTMKFNFSIYDIYSIDANLPLKLLEITTTYVVVLLQFAFLE